MYKTKMPKTAAMLAVGILLASVTESGRMDSMQVSKTVKAQELLLDEETNGETSSGIASDEQYLSDTALPELVIEAMEVETLPQDGTPADKTCGTAFQDGETGAAGMTKNGEADESGTSQTGADGEKDELVTEGAENETTYPLQTESETQSVHQPEEETHPSNQTQSEGPDKSEEKNKVNLGIDNRHVYPEMEQSFSEGYQPVIKDGILYLAIPFTASGKLKDDCLTVDLVFAEKDNAPFVFKNYQKDVIRRWYSLQNGVMMECPDYENGEAPSSEKREVYYYTCQVPLQGDAAPGQYSLTVKAWGYTELSEKAELDYQVFVRIQEPETEAGDEKSIPAGDGGGSYSGGGGGIIGEAAEEIMHQPKMLLESCNLSGEDLEAGKEKTLTASFKNRSDTQAMYNLKVIASTDTGAIRLTMNSWYFSKVAPGESIEISDEIRVDQTVEDETACLNFDFEYEDKKGTSAAGKESVALSLVQPASVEFEMTMVPSVLYASDTMELSFQAMNLSRTGVYNVRMNLSGEGLFPKEDVFIGNMDAGTQGNGTMQVYVGTRTMQEIGNDPGEGDAEKYGPVSGSVTLQYEDRAGETHTVTKEYKSEIKKPEVLSLKVEEEPEANSWWISIAAALIAGLAGVSLLLLGKLRRTNVLLEAARKSAEALLHPASTG